jgi:AraC-like DNA-binding protein
MFNWMVRVHTEVRLPSFPRLQAVASETRRTPAYHHEGRYRQSEEHCLFKYTLEGEGAFRDCAGEHRVPKGYGFLCQIRDPETAYYFPADARGPWTFVYACFAGGPTADMVRELVVRFGPLYALPQNEGIVRRMLALPKAGENVSMSGAESAGFVQDLLTSLLQTKEAQRAEDSAGVLVRLAQQTMRVHVNENINATDVAQELNVSREHLTRVFRQQVGVTPYQYILRQKIRKACGLLKETTLTSKEISAQLGYENPAHFTRAFRKVMHMTPTRFRAVGVVPVF